MTAAAPAVVVVAAVAVAAAGDTRLPVLIAALATCAACTVAATGADDDGPLAPLHRYEERQRARTDFAALPPADRVLGPNPADLAALPGDAGFVGVLSGDDAIVLLDARGRELDRSNAPMAPSAVAVDPGGAIWVGGRTSLELRRYGLRAGALEAVGQWRAAETGAVAALLAGPAGRLYVADSFNHRVLTVAPQTGTSTELIRCRGPRDLASAASAVIVNCSLERSVHIVPIDASGAPLVDRQVTILHDAPTLAIAAAADQAGLLVALAGPEDQPLDRSDGGFGNIDSYLYLYRIDDGGPPRRLAEINLSELDVVSPGAVQLAITSAGAVAAQVLAHGSGRRVSLVWPSLGTSPRIETHAFPPGSVALATSPSGTVAANSLLDAWVSVADPPAVTPVAGFERVADDVRLGEALFTTTLIAPFNGTSGPRSRFTCTSCHDDGYADGRTHWTGRDDVYATTRSVRGLFNNRPHFSRALDRTMTDMVDNEVAVMNRHSGRSAWFSLTADDAPWLPLLRSGGEPVDPVELRRALMAFLMVYTHEPNPAVVGRDAFSAGERRGAELFAALCETCHSARLSADDPASRVEPSRWELLVMSDNGPLVWGSDAYRQTGVEPYVHPQGSRVPSLRRLYRKWPYFTNGTADSLEEVLDRARLDPDRGAFRHDGADGAATQMRALSAAERDDLLAFLRLL